MKENPKIGVLLPVYNAARYLPMMLKTIVDQTYSNVAIYVVNDASTDISQNDLHKLVTQTLKNKLVELVQLDNNKGWAYSTNFAAKLAIVDEADYMFIANADDMMLPKCIENCYNALGNYDWVCMPIHTTNGTIHYPNIHATVDDYLIQNKMTNFSLVRTSMWDALGGYDDSLCEGNGYEDWDFWLRAVKAGYKPTILNEYLYWYRDHTEQTSKKVKQPCIDAIINKHK